jgi:hypothetical protein
VVLVSAGRREVGRDVARGRIWADSGPGDAAPAVTREQLAEARRIMDGSPCDLLFAGRTQKTNTLRARDGHALLERTEAVLRDGL